jgi:transcriptional regulator with XRE-family HTH domain
MAAAFGGLLKRHRLGLGKSLRQFCLEHGFDAGNFSRMERGLLPPPQSHDIVGRYAQALDIEEGTDDWLEFFDTAAAERGVIPPDLLSDEQVVEKLPVLFRTMRAKPIDAELLDKLVETLKRN